MRLSYHVRCCVIFVRYSNQEFSLLLSINLSGCSLGYWTPRALIFKWNLGSPYNWCATAQKKQSPPSPISSGLSPCLYNLVANNILFCGKKTDGVTNNIFYRTGVRFNVTREQNLHIDTEYCLLLMFSNNSCVHATTEIGNKQCKKNASSHVYSQCTITYN